MINPRIFIPKSLSFLESLTHQKILLNKNSHLVQGTGLNNILCNRTNETKRLEIASIDVNYIHKAIYSLQFSAISTLVTQAHTMANFQLG